MSNKIIEFSELWEMCEKLSPTTDSQEIIGRVSGVVDEIRDIYKVSVNSTDKRLVQGVKAKAVGRLLFALTALSEKEGIDVYQALKEQWEVAKAKETVLVSI